MVQLRQFWWTGEEDSASGTDRRRRRPSAAVVVTLMLVAGFAPIAFMGLALSSAPHNGDPLASGGVKVLAPPSAGTPTIVTLGFQERQNISASNQWAEGNLDYWLESHYYDTEVQIQAGKSAATVPGTIDFGMSFYFANKNAITIDWSQDWHVTLSKATQYWTKTSAPAGSSYTCPTPSNVVPIPKGGHTVDEPVDGSTCIQGVIANTTGNPTTGWVDLGGLTAGSLSKVLPVRNEPCSSISSITHLCVSGTENETAPASQHYFAVNFSAIFGPTGISPQSWWPSLPAGMSLALYFRNHLALTSVWDTAVGGAGGGSQPQFCINSTLGARLNTNYDRCGWTHVSRLGAGYAAGSSNHGQVIAPGIGAKTIPLPNVVAPSGFITVCKIVTDYESDTTGALGTLAAGWSVNVQGPFETNETKLTGTSGAGCARFGPLFPVRNYTVQEAVVSGYLNIGTIVTPSGDRSSASGSNPSASNPVEVTLAFSEAAKSTGPNVTFVNFLPAPALNETCRLTILNASGLPVNRTYAITGDTLVHNYTVTNVGNVALNVTQTHENTTVFGPNPLFVGTLAPGASHSTIRTAVVTANMTGTIQDSCSSVGITSTGIYENSSSNNCSVVIRAPHIGFVKYPVGSDHVTAITGGNVTYRITVTNTGDALARVNVSDVLGAGQTLLNGGGLTGVGQMPSVAPTSPAAGSDYAGQVTIEWDGLLVLPNETVYLNFTVRVTATTQGTVLSGAMTIVAVNDNGLNYTPSPNTAANQVTVLAPHLSFTKYPTASDNATALSGGYVTYRITVTNSGDATAVVNVSDDLGGGQTLLNGGSLTGAGQLPSATPASPASGVDYAAPVTIEWNGLNVGAGQTVYLNFTVLVTATAKDFQLTGLMTLTAVNQNGVSYTPNPNTAANVVTVLAPELSFTKYPVAGDNVTTLAGGFITYRITVTNTGDASALVNVSDALGAGQTLLNGGGLTGPGQLPSVTPNAPAAGSDYPGPVTIEWDGLVVLPNETVYLNFTVLVTATARGYQLNGSMTLTASNTNGVDYTPDPNFAGNLVTVRAPELSFTKHPVAADNVSAVPGGCVQVNISVTNSGDADALVNVSDALDAGQTLLNGGGKTPLCGGSPSPAPSGPASGSDYAAPVTISWTGVSVAAGQTVKFSFWVLVTATTLGAHLTGTMNLTGTNGNGVNYTPDPNTAHDQVTVVRSIVKLTQFGYTNSPNGTPTSGIVNGTTVYTVTFTNYGDVGAVLWGYLNVTYANGGNGVVTCWNYSGPATLVGCSLQWSDVQLAAHGHAGDSVTFQLWVSYANMSSGATVDASLQAGYTNPGGSMGFIPSGVPAKVEFTIEGT